MRTPRILASVCYLGLFQEGQSVYSLASQAEEGRLEDKHSLPGFVKALHGPQCVPKCHLKTDLETAYRRWHLIICPHPSAPYLL